MPRNSIKWVKYYIIIDHLTICFITNFFFVFNSRSQAKTLDEAECLQKAGNKPATEKACSASKICPQWHTGSWKPVSTNLHQIIQILI